MGELNGKVAVITGAGSGIARASARVFVREGARVLAADVSRREKETAAELGDDVVPFRCDVTVERDVEAMFAAAVETFGRVDAVLNVAGIVGPQPLADITLEEYDKIMAVDLKGVMLGTKHGPHDAPLGRGAIVNLPSAAGLTGSVLPISVYSAAKRASSRSPRPPQSSTPPAASARTPSVRASSKPRCPAVDSRRIGAGAVEEIRARARPQTAHAARGGTPSGTAPRCYPSRFRTTTANCTGVSAIPSMSAVPTAPRPISRTDG